MPHVHWFNIPPDWPAAEQIVLPDEEAHHARKVVRLRPGEPVVVFDGRGSEYHGAVSTNSGREVIVSVAERVLSPEPTPRLTLAVAWLHHAAAIEEIVRRGTELGVRRFSFFRAERSQRAPRRHEKWERWAVEACKQCKRAWRPDFSVFDSLSSLLNDSRGDVLLASLTGAGTDLASAVRKSDTTLVIGPEGDFTPDELESARRARRVSLGPQVYRSETAALLGAALILNDWGEYTPARRNV